MPAPIDADLQYYPGPWPTTEGGDTMGRDLKVNGCGKLAEGAAWVLRIAENHPGTRFALVGPTAAHVRDLMVNGEDGLCSEPEVYVKGSMMVTTRNWPRPKFLPRKRMLQWENGSVAYLFSADEPVKRLRGVELHRAWIDGIPRVSADWVEGLRWSIRLGDYLLGERYFFSSGAGPASMDLGWPPGPVVLQGVKDVTFEPMFEVERKCAKCQSSIYDLNGACAYCRGFEAGKAVRPDVGGVLGGPVYLTVDGKEVGHLKAPVTLKEIPKQAIPRYRLASLASAPVPPARIEWVKVPAGSPGEFPLSTRPLEVKIQVNHPDCHPSQINQIEQACLAAAREVGVHLIKTVTGDMGERLRELEAQVAAGAKLELHLLQQKEAEVTELLQARVELLACCERTEGEATQLATLLERALASLTEAEKERDSERQRREAQAHIIQEGRRRLEEWKSQALESAERAKDLAEQLVGVRSLLEQARAEAQTATQLAAHHQAVAVDAYAKGAQAQASLRCLEEQVKTLDSKRRGAEARLQELGELGGQVLATNESLASQMEGLHARDRRLRQGLRRMAFGAAGLVAGGSAVAVYWHKLGPQLAQWAPSSDRWIPAVWVLLAWLLLCWASRRSNRSRKVVGVDPAAQGERNSSQAVVLRTRFRAALQRTADPEVRALVMSAAEQQFLEDMRALQSLQKPGGQC